MIGDLAMKDYLDATGESAKRSRTVAILMVVTCVLVFTGLLNEQRSNWLLTRLSGSRSPDESPKSDGAPNPDGLYIGEKIGPPPAGWETADPNSSKMRYYDYRYKEFVGAMTHAYVDSAMLLRVPFFGIVVDVNDLGALGGITFIILLVWYRFALSREEDNLRLSFAEAQRYDNLREFYNLLAMRQVFTVPVTEGGRKRPFLRLVWNLICWLPVLLHSAVMVYDLQKPGVAKALNFDRFGLLIFVEVVFTVILVLLAFMATRSHLRIDRIWADQWAIVSAAGSAEGRPAPAGALPAGA